MIIPKHDTETKCQLFGNRLVPVAGLDQIALFVQRRHRNYRIHHGPLFN